MFSFQLADKLHMTVYQLWESMTGEEMMLWKAFCELEREHMERQQKAQEAQHKEQAAIRANKDTAQQFASSGRPSSFSRPKR